MSRRVSILFIVGLFILNVMSVTVFASGKANNSYDSYYQVIYHHIAERSPMGSEWSAWIAQAILYYSGQYALDPLLVTALFQQESGFNMAAYSRTGAVGIAQLQPETAAGLGFDPADPAQNIEGGIKYLAVQLARFNQAGDWGTTYAVAAYNAGPESVIKYQGIPPYSETKNHVNGVAQNYSQLQKEMGY
ncbi:lytic transglycosylase domain-containing protein [Pelosinus sp. sgz500959]|uniref:lytic transglycosylase domain-containing protein n=1 Tax=Pelosinus sp. sgz500959 TaxID=3242472 RepID=UPI00366F8049